MHFNQKEIQIDFNEDFYYLLGVIATDGNVYKYTTSIEVQYTDKEWIKQIESRFQNWNPRYDEFPLKNRCRVRFNSKQLTEVLANFGIYPNKSKTIQLTNKIPDKYFRHYLRGVIDGDGGIYQRRNNLELQIYSGSKDYLQSINCTICYLNKKSIKVLNQHAGVWRISYYANQCYDLLSWVYQDSNLRLERKYRTYLDFAKL